ncbi:MAG: S8 family serine peptidase [Myxococcales bacterium]|nr:S8 family serine peptidase [Myxococcales bacterium]
MKKKHVVFLDAATLTGAVSSQSVREQEAQGPARSMLELRATVLESVAQALHEAKQQNLSAEAGASRAVARMISRPLDASSMAVKGPPPGSHRVLAGIGALEIDEDKFDLAHVDSLPGAQRFPSDTAIELPPPAAQSEANESSKSWHLALIGASPNSGQGKDVLVGVLDTGIDASHPEFASVKVDFASFDPQGQKTSATANDKGDHGTHVCGLIAGATCGVAPAARLAVAQVLTEASPNGGRSGTLIQIAAGMNWLLSQSFVSGKTGVDIVNASLGGATNNYLLNACKNAPSLIVAAIGNNGRSGVGNTGSPGNYQLPNLLGVGASDAKDVVADFSDWDPQLKKPDLSAPGVDVYSAKPGGGYQLMSGTSMASPVTAGLAARELAQSRAASKPLSPSQLASKLVAGVVSVTDNPRGNKGGAGRIKA